MKSPEYSYHHTTERQPEAAQWHWTEYLGIIVDRIWIILLMVLLAVAIGVQKIRQEIPMYRSTSRIMIEEASPKVLNIEDLISSGSRNVEYFNTHVLALSSRSMVEAALARNGLGSNPRFVPQTLDQVGKITRALGFVRVEPVPRSRLIDIVVEHPDPKLAADFANSLAEQYISANLNRRMDTSMEAFGWMKKLADEYRAKIEKGRLAIHEYRKEAKEVSLEENENILVGKLKSVSTELTAAESQKSVVAAEWTKVEAALKMGQPLGELSVISQDESVKQTQLDLQRKQSEVALMRTRYQSKHPAMVKVLHEERELRSLYDKACTDAVRRVESRYKLAVEKVVALSQALERQEQESFELDRKLVKYNELKREVEADQQIYDTIVTRMKETKIVSDVKTSNIRLVDEAEPAGQPFRPLLRRTLTTSLVFGLILGIGISFGLYFLDDRLKRIEDVEHSTAVRLLAVVPHAESAEAKDRALMAERDPKSVPAEAFRSLRASLALRPEWPRVRRLMISSTTAGEGKSLVSSNLAIVLAHDGQRTLLIDGDMRCPKIHRMFEIESKVGLSDVLKGACPVEKAICSTPITNLSMIFAGNEPDNPSELLGSQAMKKMLEKLDGKFDRIILDCPPVFGVSDPISVLPMMDGILFVVHYGTTGRRAAIRALDRIREGSTPILGVVFNDVPLKFSSGYNYYYRYYGYGYGKGRPPR